jgi:hypothetical protein
MYKKEIDYSLFERKRELIKRRRYKRNLKFLGLSEIPFKMKIILRKKETI